MVGRGRDNRIEPECWPHVEPGFHFTKDQKFFAIGSCFAKNISKRLALDGYNVLGASGAQGQRRNRYTPPGIYQELAWAGEIYRRDDDPRDEDILPLLLELGPDRWADIWSPPDKGIVPTLQQALENRKQLYAYLRGAFEADVVIITLGLIEGWWDEVSQSYVIFDTPWARRPDRDRFKFERLTFQQCKDYVERTLKLLLDGKRRILMTTSPVVLARTFTDEDIIIANNHSKSVLRAVCGELSDDYPNVDYFPSYEIATMTRRPEVWDDDLVHIQPNFVARIMQHVTNAYVPGSVGVDDRTLMKMANLVESRRFDEAAEIYQAAGEGLWNSSNAAVHAAGMALARERGDQALAVRHALMLDVDEPLLYAYHPEWMFAAAHLLRNAPEHSERGTRIIEAVRRACAEKPDLYRQSFVALERSGNEAALRAFVDLIIEDEVDEPLLVHRACVQLQKWGELPRTLDLCTRQLRHTPDHPRILAAHARVLIGLGRIDDALEPLGRLVELQQDEWAMLAQARMLNRLGLTERALEAVDRLLQNSGDHAQGLALKASLLWKRGFRQEATETARRALDAAPEDPVVAQSAQLVLRGEAA